MTLPRLSVCLLLLGVCQAARSAYNDWPSLNAARGEALDAADGAPARAGGAGAHWLGYEHKTMAELVVEQAGYPLEEHFVTTADGYVLGTYRIPYGRQGAGDSNARSQQSILSRGQNAAGADLPPLGDLDMAHPAAAAARALLGVPTAASSAAAGNDSPAAGDDPPAAACARPAVLLLHGLLDSSAAWVLNEPDQSLGFILADAGYDVWLGNSRGNAFSRNHTGWDPASAAFWDFTWDDMAAYDVPAVVDYVLSQTGCRQLAYVGHSQGTTQMFAALSTNPTVRSKLAVAVMLAPAVHMRYIQAPALQALAAMDADKLFNLLGVAEFLPSRRAIADLFGQLCRQTPLVCASIITAIAGFNADNMNLTRLPTMVQYAPSGTSVKNLAHWAQALRKSQERQRPLFQMYDYGDVCTTRDGLPRTCNMRVYHSLEPPSYDLGAISTPPLAIFHGGRDRLADSADVATLLEALPRDAVVYSQLEDSYEHIDFTWGIDAKYRIYPAVLDVLRMYR